MCPTRLSQPGGPETCFLNALEEPGPWPCGGNSLGLLLPGPAEGLLCGLLLRASQEKVCQPCPLVERTAARAQSTPASQRPQTWALDLPLGLSQPFPLPGISLPSGTHCKRCLVDRSFLPLHSTAEGPRGVDPTPESPADCRHLSASQLIPGPVCVFPTSSWISGFLPPPVRPSIAQLVVEVLLSLMDSWGAPALILGGEAGMAEWVSCWKAALVALELAVTPAGGGRGVWEQGEVGRAVHLCASIHSAFARSTAACRMRGLCPQNAWGVGAVFPLSPSLEGGRRQKVSSLGKFPELTSFSWGLGWEPAVVASHLVDCFLQKG